MEKIQARIEQIEREKESLNPNNRDDQFKIRQLDNELEELKAKLNRLQEQEQHIDGLLQSVIEIDFFGAIEPEPDENERLHEYDERKKEFNLLLYEFVREQQRALIDQHNAEIEEKDQQQRAIQEKIYALEEEISERDNEIERHITENSALKEKIAQINANVEKARKDLEAEKRAHTETRKLLDESGLKNKELHTEVESLKDKLEQAQKPKEYAKPSEDLKERVASLKAKSQRDPDELVKAFMERQKASEENGGRYVVKSITPPSLGGDQPNGDTFRTENIKAEPKDGGIPAAKEIKPFQNAGGVPQIQSSDQQEDRSAEGKADQPVSRAEFERLAARVTQLEVWKDDLAG